MLLNSHSMICTGATAKEANDVVINATTSDNGNGKAMRQSNHNASNSTSAAAEKEIKSSVVSKKAISKTVSGNTKEGTLNPPTKTINSVAAGGAAPSSVTPAVNAEKPETVAQ